jgi:mannose-1-phosphate guanylyltransferase
MRLPDGETLLGKTVARARALPSVVDVVTVTNRDLYFQTRDVYAALEFGTRHGRALAGQRLRARQQFLAIADKCSEVSRQPIEIRLHRRRYRCCIGC